MLTVSRLKEANMLKNSLKMDLHFNSNRFMIKYYNRFIHRLDMLIQKYV